MSLPPGRDTLAFLGTCLISYMWHDRVSGHSALCRRDGPVVGNLHHLGVDRARKNAVEPPKRGKASLG